MRLTLKVGENRSPVTKGWVAACRGVHRRLGLTCKRPFTKCVNAARLSASYAKFFWHLDTGNAFMISSNFSCLKWLL